MRVASSLRTLRRMAVSPLRRVRVCALCGMGARMLGQPEKLLGSCRLSLMLWWCWGLIRLRWRSWISGSWARISLVLSSQFCQCSGGSWSLLRAWARAVGWMGGSRLMLWLAVARVRVCPMGSCRAQVSCSTGVSLLGVRFRAASRALLLLRVAGRTATGIRGRMCLCSSSAAWAAWA